MSNFSYDDFAVLVRSFKLNMLDSDSLRIVPLSTAPSMADAIHGTNLGGLDSELNLPKEKNGSVVRSNVTVQHASTGYCRLVGHIEAKEGQDAVVKTAKAFVLYHLVENATTEGGEKAEKAEVIAVASLKEGFAIGDVCYPSFTITTVNNYQSVAFNPNAFATVEDLKNINGLDGLHIAFDTASGDLKLLDKDGNVLDQANLPIKADVIIADGEEGYKYVKTDVNQDIHAAKAWMPEHKTAWEYVEAVPYTGKHAALVVGKGSSRVFIGSKSGFTAPISTEGVQFNHVEIGGSTYMVNDLGGSQCRLLKVKGKDAVSTELMYATISDGNVKYGDQSYTIKNGKVYVDVIKKDGITYVLVETSSQEFQARTPAGDLFDLGRIETPRVFVDVTSKESHTISTELVQFDHVVIDNSIYMLIDKTETRCSLRKVMGEAGESAITEATISEGSVKYEGTPYDIMKDPVEVDVIKGKGEYSTTTYVLAETDKTDGSGSKMFQAWNLEGTSPLYNGTIETSGGSSTGGVVGITLDGQSMYTFEKGATIPSEFKNISDDVVTWFGTKNLPKGYTLKYGLEAFVWTVKDAEAGGKIIDPFFNKLNNSLLALGFHEGDDIALGTNLAKLSTDLNHVDADDYMHGETINESGKTNKAAREKEVDDQRKLAKEGLVAWNAQHPALTQDVLSGTRISSSGVDIRNGKIEIGNGTDNKGEDNVKRYVIETDIDAVSEGARTGKGLQIGVIDSAQKGSNGPEPIQKDILTINAEDYISGAPTCLALLKCSKGGDSASVSASLEGGRITANFTAIGNEADGAFTLKITDNRANNGFGSDPRIVEIIPVYKSGADADEAVPAQRSISAIAQAKPDNETGKSTLSIKCSQVIDWAQSIDLGGTVVQEGQGTTVGNDMELYLIVKVY